jgi:hypothetical protein
MENTSTLALEVPAVRASCHRFEETCANFLVGAQNADGGWPWHRGETSAAEATAWSILALGGMERSAERSRATERGIYWLERMQLAEGAWAAFEGHRMGCWVTAPACLALARSGGSEQALVRGAQWLCEAWPAEGGVWWKLRSRLLGRNSVVEQNSTLCGWNWTPGTASWVEPTAHALIALQAVGKALSPAEAGKRIEMGEAMLYDRMCAGGGWNSGNPMVYGASGIPRIGSTAWALLALRGRAERAENRASLDWLEGEYEGIEGAASLAVAHLCLAAYGRAQGEPSERLEAMHGKNGFLRNIGVTAWAAMALGGAGKWLGMTAGVEVRQ